MSLLTTITNLFGSAQSAVERKNLISEKLAALKAQSEDSANELASLETEVDIGNAEALLEGREVVVSKKVETARARVRAHQAAVIAVEAQLRRETEAVRAEEISRLTIEASGINDLRRKAYCRGMALQLLAAREFDQAGGLQMAKNASPAHIPIMIDRAFPTLPVDHPNLRRLREITDELHGLGADNPYRVASPDSVPNLPINISDDKEFFAQILSVVDEYATLIGTP